VSVEIFIAKRILTNRSQGIKVSRPILRIAVISISLSIVVNLLTLAVVNGFQNEIRRKVTGFSAPLFIQNENNADFYESDPIHSSKMIEDILSSIDDVQGFNRVAYKPGLIQAIGTRTDVIGLVFKGIDSAYNFTFLKEHLKEGKIPDFAKEASSSDILVSARICKQLNLKLNDEVSAFFVKDSPISRTFNIVGIYDTGFEDYDEKLVICDIRVTQKLNDWGISGQLDLWDSLVNNKFVVSLTLQGNPSNLSYDWGKGLTQFRGQYLPTELSDTTLHLKLYETTSQNKTQLIDSHQINIRYLNTARTAENASSEPYKEILDESGLHYRFYYPLSSEETRIYEVKITAGNGTSDDFISGYEIHTKDWYRMKETNKDITKPIKLIPTEHGEMVKVVSIFDLEQDLFNWLAFLDINVVIILVLMMLIGIINMGSALLVLIIIRSNFIGLMKAMGCSDGQLRRIFLIQAAYLVGSGMLIGNLVGLGIYWIQRYTGALKLNPEVYYLDKVPMELTFNSFLFLNIVSFAVCMIALLLPSALIARVNPVKTIKFN
jgi:lipoprotein-releasing system permease protein